MATQLNEEDSKGTARINRVKKYRDESVPVQQKALAEEMRTEGYLAPGRKPKTRDYERYAAYKTAEAATMKAASLAKDMAALERAHGGMAGLLLDILSNPAAGKTEKALAVSAMQGIYKQVPTVINGEYAKEGETDNVNIFDDDELEAVRSRLKLVAK